jgi:acetyl-CoA carboxylase biotin carboxylase subunit
MEYDPLLAKLAVWAPTRNEAISRMARALDETHIDGIKTNTAFLREIICDPEFAAGALHTGFIEEFFARRKPDEQPSDALLAKMIAAIAESRKTKSAATPERAAVEASKWLTEGRSRLLR